MCTTDFMTEKEIKAGLLTLDETHEFYRALLGLLEEAILAEQDNVTIPLLTDSARQFNAGRLAHAKDFKQLLHDTRVEAIREREQEEKARELRERKKSDVNAAG